MKQKTLIALLFAGVLFSCNKSSQRSEMPAGVSNQENKNIISNSSSGKGGSFTLYSPNVVGSLKTMFSEGTNQCIGGSQGGFVNNFSLTLNCSGATVLNLNEVVLQGQDEPGQIRVNGIPLTLTFDYSIPGCINVYKLLNISSAQLGGLDLSNPNVTLSFSFFHCDQNNVCDINNSANWQTTQSFPLSQYACTAGSAQPLANSPGANQLYFLVPIPICVPPVFVSESYQFRYRVVGTTTWTETAVYPESQYRFSGVTISGVPSGTYEYEGRNVCSGSTGPWVPGTGTNVVVN